MNEKYNADIIKKYNIKVIKLDFNGVNSNDCPSKFIRKLETKIRKRFNQETKKVFINPYPIIHTELDKYFINKYKVGEVIIEEISPIVKDKETKKIIDIILENILNRLEVPNEFGESEDK